MKFVGPFGIATPAFLLFRGDGAAVIACSSPFSGYRSMKTGAVLGRFAAVAVPGDGSAEVAALERRVGFDASALVKVAGGHGYGATVQEAARAALSEMKRA